MASKLRHINPVRVYIGVMIGYVNFSYIFLIFLGGRVEYVED